MSDSESTSRRGRRARALSPEESAALESRTASVITGEMSPIPGARGAVAAPEADAPVPKLRKFGRRARIIELTDPVEEQIAGHGAEQSTEAGGEPAPDQSTGEPGDPKPAEAADQGADETAEQGADETAEHAATAATSPGSADAPSEDVPPASGTSGQTDPEASSPTGAPAPARRATGVERDRDGVELGELPVSEAPDPRPAPRFDGKVLHSPERSGGRSLLWIVWVLIAVAIAVLIALMVTGVLGQDASAAALSPLDVAASELTDPSATRPALEEAAA